MPGLTSAAEGAEQAAALAMADLQTKRLEAATQRQSQTRLAEDVERVRGHVEQATGDGAPVQEHLGRVDAELTALEQGESGALAAADAASGALLSARAAAGAADGEHQGAVGRAGEAEARLAATLDEGGFATEDEARSAHREAAARTALRTHVQAHRAEATRLETERARIEGRLAGRQLTQAQWAERVLGLEAAETAARTAQEGLGVAQEALQKTRGRHGRWVELEARRLELEGTCASLGDLQGVLRGGAFVEFIAEEQLRGVAVDASARLGHLTRYRYALEVDAQGGFCVRDDWNAGTRRPVSTLSGGETFLASLALALSAQIQLRGRHPLQFFFLDEGFGTLDPEALDTALSALEHLQAESVHIGIISHVPEVRARLARRVIVDPAEPGGRGSRLRIEVA